MWFTQVQSLLLYFDFDLRFFALVCICVISHHTHHLISHFVPSSDRYCYMHNNFLLTVLFRLYILRHYFLPVSGFSQPLPLL